MCNALQSTYPWAYLSIDASVAATMEGMGMCHRGGAQWLEPSPKPAALLSSWRPAPLWLPAEPEHPRPQFPVHTATVSWDTAWPLSPPCLGWDTPASVQSMRTSWGTPCRRQYSGCSKGNSSFSRMKLGCNFTPTLGRGTTSAQTWLSSNWLGHKRQLPQIP